MLFRSGRNIKISTTDFNNYTLSTYNPTWVNQTYLLSNFVNNLNGGNVDGVLGAIQSWYLYREEIGGSGSLEFLKKFSATDFQYFDFTVINNRTYKYHLFAKDLSLSSLMYTNEEISDYYGWFLIDSENNRAYHFDINFSGGDKIYTQKFTEHKTNNKVNAFTKGNSFFIEGSINAIISKDNLRTDSQYTNDDLLSLSEFISSDRPKILKSRRGEIFNIFTYGYQETLLNPALSQNIYTSSFNFKEVGDL